MSILFRRRLGLRHVLPRVRPSPQQKGHPVRKPNELARGEYAPKQPQHPNLNYSKAQIRLLCFDDDNRFSLQVFDLDGVPPYIALSYMWGPDEPASNKDIILNGHTFSVRRNLYNALNAIRAAGKETYYWIDAICIDQSSMLERNHQVNLMRNIFSGAAYVLVWLGSEYSHALKSISTWELAQLNKLDLSPAKLFLTSPYWSRIWIVQEFALAKEIRFLSQSSTIPLSELTHFIGHFMRPFAFYPTTIDLPKSQTLFARRVLSERETHQKYGQKKRTNSTFEKTVRHFCVFQSTDPRDTIYALLSLIDWKGKNPLFADYTLSERELCLKLINEFGIHPGNLSLRLRMS